MRQKIALLPAHILVKHMNQSCEKELEVTVMHRLESMPTVGCRSHPQMQPPSRCVLMEAGTWSLRRAQLLQGQPRGTV